MATFGWCNTGHHGFEGDRKEYGLCPGKVGNTVCDCECHTGVHMRRATVYTGVRIEDDYDETEEPVRASATASEDAEAAGGEQV